MGFFKSFTRDRGVAGSLTAGTLGAVVRSVGYLQGGYYTGANGTNSSGVAFTTGPGTEHAWSQVQQFNTVSQTGSIVYDTGYNRRYYAGISGNLSGYFSIDATVNYNKFNYITASASSSFTTTNFNACTSIDLGLYTQAWILESTSEVTTGTISNWTKVNLSNDTTTSEGSLSAIAVGTSRQAMNTATDGFFCSTGGPEVYSFNYSSMTAYSQATNTLVDTNIQIPCGMSVSNTYGYFVGLGGASSSSRNIKITVSGDTVSAYSSSNGYTYEFGESHSLVGDVAGYMMAGYPDTSGRYSSVQHALCQRMQISTEAISTLPDLVLPQSSGQMMQGF